MNELLTGNLLVASSLATDPVYSRGVCLVVHQDESNVIGVILNRPMTPSPKALLEMLRQEPGNHESGKHESGNRLSQYREDAERENPKERSSEQDQSSGFLHFGGPRSGPVVAIHQTSQYAEAETGAGIYLAAQKQHLEELVRDHPAPYRLIVGHLGWELAELASEFHQGLWHIVPATTDAVFSTASEMWPSLIRRATSGSLAQWLGIRDVVGAADLN